MTVPARVLFLSRPFEGRQEVAGEQVFARSLTAAFDQHFRVKRIRRFFVEPNGRISSLLFYDWVMVVWMAIRNLFCRYDVVIFNSPFQAPLSFLFRLTGTKTIVVVHDLFFIDNELRTLFDKYSRYAYRVGLKYASKIVATTPHTADELERFLGIHATVCQAFPGPEFRAVARDFVASKTVGPHVGYIGGYCPHRKRVGCLVQFLRVNQSVPLTFHFAGPVNQIFLDAIAPVKSEWSRYEVHGLLSEEEKLALFKRLSFLYFPSRLEGVGLPLLEAFAAGVLPIVHEDAKIPEVIKSRCEQVSGPDGAVQRIAYCLEHAEEFSQKVLINYDYAQQQFSPESIVSLVKDLYGGQSNQGSSGDS